MRLAKQGYLEAGSEEKEQTHCIYSVRKMKAKPMFSSGSALLGLMWEFGNS